MKKLLLAIALTVGLSAPAVDAQTSTAATQVQQVITQVQSVLNGFINFANQLENTDLNLAIALAQSQGNTTAATCWQTIQKVQIVQVPSGAGLAWLKQYYLGLAAQYVNLNQACATVAPAYLQLYNKAIQQMQALNL